MQHNALSWNILGGNFIKIQELSKSSLKSQELINQWVDEMTPIQKEQFVNAIKNIISMGQIDSINGLKNLIPMLLFNYKNMDPQVISTLKNALFTLYEIGLR